jgi:ATP-dependent Lon protease
MRDFRDAKAMAQSLREALKAKSVSLTYSESLELIARTLGVPDWNVLAARIQASQSTSTPPGSTISVTAPPTAVAGAGVPVIPMRDLVLFPQMVTPIFVGRERTRRAVDSAMAGDGRILVVTQRRSADDEPTLDALYPVGVTASVINRMTLPDGTLKVFVSGLKRAALVRLVDDECLAAEIAPVDEERSQTAEALNLSRAVLEAYQIYANVDFSDLARATQTRFGLPHIGDPGMVADSIAPMLSIGIDKRQQLLETGDVVTRLETLLELMDRPPA